MSIAPMIMKSIPTTAWKWIMTTSLSLKQIESYVNIFIVTCKTYKNSTAIYFLELKIVCGKNIAFMASIPTMPYDKNMLM